MKKQLFLGCLVVGLVLLGLVGWPYLQFKIWELTEYNSQQVLISPTGGNVLGVATLANPEDGSFGNSNYVAPPYSEFYLTVPKLKLNHTTVLVYSTNFDKFLAHLPGTALPGEKGNVFVTGHSSVPFLPFDKEKAIFNNLTDLKKGDIIKVEALGQQFNYVVEGVKVVEPTDTYVINPPDSEGRYLTLMTCVPPGFNTKRLIVLAKMREN
jgi:LPXTG-site transpeptidase (sortase) family protein